MRCSLPFYSPSYSDDIRKVLSQAGNLQAMEREARSLAGNSFSHRLDLDKKLHLKSLIEELVEAGSLVGLELKSRGLRLGKYGCGSGPFEDDPNPAEAERLIESLAAKGCKHARYMKIYSLLILEKNYEAAKPLIIELSREESSPARASELDKKFCEILSEVWYGFDEDVSAVHQKLDTCARAGDPVALKLKLNSLENPLRGK